MDQFPPIFEITHFYYHKDDLPSMDGGVPANRPDGDVLAGLVSRRKIILFFFPGIVVIMKGSSKDHDSNKPGITDY